MAGISLYSLVVWDYVVFVCVLTVSIGIGIFFGCRKQKTANDFFMAGRSMGPIPVAASMIATFMSGITLLGTPGEIYVYGTQYMWMVFAFIAMCPFVAHVFLPVFYNLHCTSMFEYLELRFHKSLRICFAFLFIVQMLLYMAVVLYTPALAFNVVTGINTWIWVCAIGLVCIFYTALGGMKAVLWTDLFQCLMMFGGLIAVLAKGSSDHEGGFTDIWRKLEENGRVQFFELNPDPTVRHTLWGLAIGGTFHWVASYAANQAQMQRMLCVASLKKAQLAVWLNCPGLILIVVVCSMCGMVINAEYMGCDPMQVHGITRDQLLPLYVMDKLAEFPGLPGFYIACIFSAGLSTLSSGLNSLAVVTLCDMIKQVKTETTERFEHVISKTLPVAYGLIAIVLSYFCYLAPGLLQACIALFGIVSGPMCGVFTLGILFPFVNSIGAWSGLVTALGFMIWVSIGGRIVTNPNPHPPSAPLQSVANCSVLEEATTSSVSVLMSTMQPSEQITTMMQNMEDDNSAYYLPIYGISYIWYATFTIVIAVVVGIVVSLITCGNGDRKFDHALFHPVVKNMCGYPEEEEHQEKPTPFSNGMKDTISDAPTVEPSGVPQHNRGTSKYSYDNRSFVDVTSL